MREPGFVDIRMFDEGLVVGLGGTLLTLPSEKQTYAVPAPAGVSSPPGYEGYVPLHVVPADSAFVPKIVPCIVVRPRDPSPALDRAHSGGKYRWPSPEAIELSVTNSLGETKTGWTAYLERPLPDPYDIIYEVQLYARGRNAAQRLLMYVQRLFPPRDARVKLTDSAGEERTYETFLESTVNMTDVSGVVEGTVSYNLTLRVLGELELGFDVQKRAFTGGTPQIGVGQVDS